MLEKARSGDLRTVACPNCYDDVPINAPLLIYQPKDDPHLIYVLSLTTNYETERQQLNDLLNVLRLDLRDIWQEEWTENIRVVPQELLTLILSEGWFSQQ